MINLHKDILYLSSYILGNNGGGGGSRAGVCLWEFMQTAIKRNQFKRLSSECRHGGANIPKGNPDVS